MLQRLKAGERRAELLAGAQVVDGGLKQRRHDSEHFGARRQPDGIDNGCEIVEPPGKRASESVPWKEIALAAEPSTRRKSRRSMPGTPGATRWNSTPEGSSFSPCRRAETIQRSADAASGTTILSPCNASPASVERTWTRTSARLNRAVCSI